MPAPETVKYLAKRTSFLGTIIIYVLFVYVPAMAQANPKENIHPPVYVLLNTYTSDAYVDPPQKIKVVDIQDIYNMRVEQIFYQDKIIRPLLNTPELQPLKNVYLEKIGILADRPYSFVNGDEKELTTLIESTLKLQDFILQNAIYNQALGVNNNQEGFNHWQLALSAMQIGLSITIITALIWRR